MPTVPLEETIWVALAVIVAGGVSGILAGLFGIGGGAVSGSCKRWVRR